ncbi:MAG: hypothetical protein AAGJ51_11495 [Pseudomonadota bacterium]
MRSFAGALEQLANTMAIVPSQNRDSFVNFRLSREFMTVYRANVVPVATL